MYEYDLRLYENRSIEFIPSTVKAGYYDVLHSQREKKRYKWLARKNSFVLASTITQITERLTYQNMYYDLLLSQAYNINIITFASSRQCQHFICHIHNSTNCQSEQSCNMLIEITSNLLTEYHPKLILHIISLQIQSPASPFQHAGIQKSSR